MSFSSPPAHGEIAVDDEVDCFGLPGVASGDQLSIRFRWSALVNGSPRWWIRDGGGEVICSSSSLSTPLCSLMGTPGWSIEIGDSSGSATTFSYSIAVRRLTDPEGCTPIAGPEEWSYSDPRFEGSITSSMDSRCFSFSRPGGAPDGNYWFRAFRTSGSLTPIWRVYSPSGGHECSGEYAGFENRCRLLGFGQFALVVEPGGDQQAGAFGVTTRRLSQPAGCSPAPSFTIGASPSAGSIAAAGETDCYSLAGLSAGENIGVGFTSIGGGSGESPRVTVIDGEGQNICDSYYGFSNIETCHLTGAAGWHLVVYDRYASGIFSYSLSVRRLSDPQGCDPLGDPGIWSFASPRLDGSIDGALDARCYTFNRAPGEEDGVYWFRTTRSAGTLSPAWTVFGPTGEKECEGSSASSISQCPLQSAGQHMLMIEDSNGDDAGSYYVTARRLTNPAGCATLDSVAFDAPPQNGAISPGAKMDCFELPDLQSGDSVLVDFLTAGSSGASPNWSIVNDQGNVVCERSYYWYPSCPLQGSSDFSLVVYDGGPGTFSYSLAVRRLTAPEGCTPLGEPGVWSFTSPRINGTVASELASRCYTFNRSLAEPDGSYWFRALRTSGTLTPRWEVFGPTGERECHGTTEGSEAYCRLLASGQFSVIVRDDGGDQTGAYFLTAKQLNLPSGCTSISSIALGVATVSGKLGSGGEVDCYRLSASAQDILKFSATGSMNAFSLLDDEGVTRCRFFHSECLVDEDGEMTLLAYSTSGAATGNYTFAASCENAPCGQSNTAVADVTPSRVGPGSYTSVLLRGRDLDLLQSAELLRNGQTVEGHVLEPAPDGRAIELRFDLAGAALGAWELKATFSDGTIRNLPGAVTVEPLRPARIAVELVGREAFRAGRPSDITVSVHNSGNVDGMIVPVILSGIPAGSVVEPQFQMQTPSGGLPDPGMTNAPYNQATDTLTFKNGIAVPLYLPRVPAGRSQQLGFRVTAPMQGTSYKLRAVAGQCLGGTTAPAPGLTTQGVAVTAAGPVFDPNANCMEDVTQQMISFVPFGDCFNVGYEAGSLLHRGLFDPMLAAEEDNPVSWLDGLSFGLSVAGCGLDFTGIGAVAKRAVTATDVGMAVIEGGVLGGQLADDCWVAQSEAELPQTLVTAIDPNEIIGPAGVGEERYIPGEEPLDYKILFENLPIASAPAQRVEIKNQLNTAHFAPASVLFSEVRFGSTVFSLPYASHEIEETIDLRPERELLVEVEASVSAGGLIDVSLQAIDPETLEPPTDPLAGFLPPNMSSPEGEGLISYGVTPKALASGTVLSNQASIVFDENEPIETPTWTNVVDREPPVPSVSAEVGDAPSSAEVSWSGADDAAGISLYEIRVSKDGGPFALWRTSAEPGSATFPATESGTYSFRAIARDGADNVGQSSLAGIALKAERTITVGRAGSGSGTVNSSPAGIQCGPSCVAGFPGGATVTLQASPEPGSVFSGWSGAGCAGTGACTVKLTADVGVSARFDSAPPNVPNPSPTPTPGPGPGPGRTQAVDDGCEASATKAFGKAMKAAKRKKGKARAAAIRAAKKRKAKGLSRCQSPSASP